MTNRKRFILVYSLAMIALCVLCACGIKKYQTDIKHSGGIYMEYQISKDAFTYEDEYENALQNVVYNIQNRLNTLCEAKVYINQENICIEILSEQDPNKIEKLINEKAELYIISEYDDSGNTNFSRKDKETTLCKPIDEIVSANKTKLTNTEIASAGRGKMQDSNGKETNYIEFILTKDGTILLKDMTQKAVAKGQTRIAFVFDGKIIDAPLVKGVITDGRVRMACRSADQAKKISTFLNFIPLDHELKQTECVVIERKKLKK